MKISHVHIKDHQQFKDFKLDLTYPKGHEKEGQPLDKVCFIGQSGTGKTTLLESLMRLNSDARLTTMIPLDQIEITYKNYTDMSFYSRGLIITNTPSGVINNKSFIAYIDTSSLPYSSSTKIDQIKKYDDSIEINKKHYHKNVTRYMNDSGGKLDKELQTLAELYGFLIPVYFPILSNKKLSNYHGDKHLTVNSHTSRAFFFSLDSYKENWNLIKSKIEIHQNQVIKYNNAIARAAIKKDEQSMNKYIKQLKAWADENETPLLDLADNYLDKILNDFHLKIKTELESLKEMDSIHLINTETLETIPEEYWSSGIKNIIARTLPLYIHDFREHLICIDEPENSLYPDIQRKIVDIYTSLTTDCQFFFATHSPIIASSFEPWEIVELKFNDKGYVYREQYWEGENHVDNYKYDPRYLRWDSILTQIFDLEEEGGAERKQMLQDFAQLDNDLKARQKAGEKLDKNHTDVKRLMKMGQLLGWNTK